MAKIQFVTDEPFESIESRDAPKARTKVRFERLSGSTIPAPLWRRTLAGLLTVILEYQNPPLPIGTISPKGVVIVLGGGLAERAHMWRHRRPRDAAALLWRRYRRLSLLVTICRGRAFSATNSGFAAQLLQAYGIPPDSIIVESNSGNTHENAINAAAIWRERHVRSGMLQRL